MKHKSCECNTPTNNCPRYGWMRGYRYDICQGKIQSESRDVLLDSFIQVQEPNLITKVTNLTNSLIDYALKGFQNVTKESYQHRLDVCDKCEFCKKEDVLWTCLSCGCNVKIAAAIATKDCPLNRWPLPIVSNDIETKSGTCC